MSYIHSIAPQLRIVPLICILCGLLGASAAKADPLKDAVSLYEQRRFAEAQAALEPLVAADPNNAAACRYLGLALHTRGDEASLATALGWLAKAVQLEPNNAANLGDYGGVALELASKKRSLALALKGRDAMERAIQLAPDYIEAREGLMQFYQQAPWPVGSPAKAAQQLEAIRQHDSERADSLTVQRHADAKQFDRAFRLADELLARNPDNYIALYHYGRTAAISGENLENGLARLQRCLELVPISPAAAQHTHVWNRMGNVFEKLGRSAEATVAYENALKLDPANKHAAKALKRLK